MTSRIFRSAVAISTLGVMVPLAGCSDAGVSPERSPEADVSLLPPEWTPDTTDVYVKMPTHSDNLAQFVDGFGGVYVDNDILNVLLAGETSPDAQEDARQMIRAYLDSVGRSELSIQFKPAQYTFIRLRMWENRVLRLPMNTGVHQIGVDERFNRLFIRVSSEEQRTVLLKLLSRLGIPTAATFVEVAPPAVAL